jgi:hypothetical protein
MTAQEIEQLGREAKQAQKVAHQQRIDEEKQTRKYGSYEEELAKVIVEGAEELTNIF